MATAKKSEDQRISALEESVPEIARSLSDLRRQLSELQTQGNMMIPFGVGGYAVSADSALFEQTLGLLRSIYWRQPVPSQFLTTVADSSGVCLEIEIVNPAIGMGQDGRIEDSPPFRCVDLLAVTIGNGRAIFYLCCRDRDEISDCKAEVNFIIHRAGNPDNVVYQEAQTIKCRGRRTRSPV